MKVYRAVYHADPDMGTTQLWAASKREAMSRRNELADDVSSVEVEAVDIPTDKAGLIGWLNANFNTNNG